MDSVYVTLVRVLGVLLWSAAAWHKLRDPQQFRAILQQYQAPVPQLHGLFAALLIAAEIALVFGFLFSVTLIWACWGSVGLLVLYAIALVREIRAGRTDHACGCGGFARTAQIGWPLVVRNFILAGVFAAATLSPRPRPWTWLDSFTIIAASLAFVLLYRIVDLLAQDTTRNPRGKIGHTPSG
ncbi:MAG: hypothetical protein KatS3mg077_1929 [Candidatus Binatia bacterium]|nr:MAG: hypothetical protein KatS3mg077_1929 [Candidatus Binatia bacterium]